MYRRTSKYQAQRRLGPIGGRTPRDPEDEPKPLPELWGRSDYFPMGGYTADQMRAYARAEVLKERERCAKLCDEFDPNDDAQGSFEVLADIIRSGPSNKPPADE